ncbi:hypothetical protein K3X44_10055 [Aliiroseovarius crassostreae]|uniref:hypothetical protein n=1 Tax=Aliiroseovarius crassostreae TaxID=154981 RepID=UPI002204FA9E|nr:hypothetical protein [Aliiroseovarius crassostreae]UWQ00857.1 hypothetical protein K3X44_10055 [Aliiroseovarius crassostreae]
MTPAEKAELVDLVIAQMSATNKVPFKPIDMDNLVHLNETGGWPEKIVQLMPGNAVSAGSPDPANNKGLFNWPLQDLTKRTSWLKTALGGIGGDAVTVANLNTRRKTGLFNIPQNATGSPLPAYDGRGIQIEQGGEATQIAIMGEEFMAFRDKDSAAGAWGDWQRLLTEKSGTYSAYDTDDAPDEWLIGENFRGDTSLTLGRFEGFCHRIGSFAHLSMELNVADFSIVASHDSSISARLDLGAIGVATGWFKDLLSFSVGTAYARLAGAGWDAPWMPLYCRASDLNSAYPSTVYFGTGDTSDLPAQASNAVSMAVRIILMVKVGD